jgi:hypothetical protein
MYSVKDVKVLLETHYQQYNAVTTPKIPQACHPNSTRSSRHLRHPPPSTYHHPPRQTHPDM